MSPLTVAACAGSALLVVVAAMPALGAARRWSTLVTFAVALGVGSAAAHWVVQRANYLPKNHVSRVVRHGVEQLERWQPRSEDLLIVDGGSYPSHAIDPSLLRTELQRLGHQVRIMQLSLGGANHFERYQLFSDVIQRAPLATHDPAKGGRVVMLAEVHNGYDRAPLAQLDENADTVRAYHYLTVTNTWHAFRSLLSEAASRQHVDVTEQVAQGWMLARHALVNLFNIGGASRILPWKRLQPRSGYLRGGVERGYQFQGLGEARAAAEVELAQLGRRPLATWLFDVREARLKDLWQGIDRWVYYSVPSSRPLHVRWTRRFCQFASKPCIPVDDLTLINQLDHRQYWQDRGHLTTSGSQIYTRWLAQRLAAEGVLTQWRAKRPKRAD